MTRLGSASHSGLPRFEQRPFRHWVPVTHKPNSFARVLRRSAAPPPLGLLRSVLLYETSVKIEGKFSWVTRATSFVARAGGKRARPYRFHPCVLGSELSSVPPVLRDPGSKKMLPGQPSQHTCLPESTFTYHAILCAVQSPSNNKTESTTRP